MTLTNKAAIYSKELHHPWAEEKVSPEIGGRKGAIVAKKVDWDSRHDPEPMGLRRQCLTPTAQVHTKKDHQITAWRRRSYKPSHIRTLTDGNRCRQRLAPIALDQAEKHDGD